MFKIRKKSGWAFNTSAGDSMSFAFVSVGSGMFALNAPDGRVVEFGYSSAGAGFSVGSKVNLSNSTQDNFSDGQVYVLDTFAGAELTTSDIEGFCLVQEVAIGAMKGWAGTAMLLGIPLKSLPAEAVKNTGALGAAAQLVADHPETLLGPLGIVVADKLRILDKVRDVMNELLRSNAKALLLMHGFNAGAQLQAGLSGSVGYVKFAKVQPVKPQPVPVPPPPPRPPDPKKTVLNLHSDVLFEFDKSDLKPKAETVLKEVESQIRSISPRRIVVEGHTDGIGDPAYNMALSRRRAQSVTTWLLARKVVAASQLGTYGYGMLKPVAPNTRPNGTDNPEGRAQNRRVEVWLMKY